MRDHEMHEQETNDELSHESYELDELEYEGYGELDEVSQEGFGEVSHETYGEVAHETYGEVSHEGHQELELELASELLEVQSEQELENFLGGLFRRVAQGARTFVRSPMGRALGGVLRNVARTALPAIGNAVLPGVGGAIASMAGRAFGLELEGLSNEEAEFELARRYVRLATAATRRAARTARTAERRRVPITPPAARNLASRIVLVTARRYAPGLTRAMLQDSARGPAGAERGMVVATPFGLPRRRGTWRLVGRQLVIDL